MEHPTFIAERITFLDTDDVRPDGTFAEKIGRIVLSGANPCSMGHPKRVGIEHGWSMERFLARSTMITPKGTRYQNLCIGCDAFHDAVLGPVLEQAREQRPAARSIICGQSDPKL